MEKSKFGADGLLGKMVISMPNVAIDVLNKCEERVNGQTKYDFFALQTTGIIAWSIYKYLTKNYLQNRLGKWIDVFSFDFRIFLPEKVRDCDGHESFGSNGKVLKDWMSKSCCGEEVFRTEMVTSHQILVHVLSCDLHNIPRFFYLLYYDRHRRYVSMRRCGRTYLLQVVSFTSLLTCRQNAIRLPIWSSCNKSIKIKLVSIMLVDIGKHVTT